MILQTKYTPSLYKDEVYLVKANQPSEQALFFENDPCNGWQPYVESKIKNYMVSTTHENLFANECITQVGTIVQEIINKFFSKEKI